MKINEKDLFEKIMENELPVITYDSVSAAYARTDGRGHCRSARPVLRMAVAAFAVLVVGFSILCAVNEPVRASVTRFLYTLTGSEVEKDVAVDSMIQGGAELNKTYGDSSLHYVSEVIDEEWIEKEAEMLAEVYGKSKETFYEDLLKSAHETRALYLAAKDAGITVSEEEIDEQLEALKQAYTDDKDNMRKIVDASAKAYDISVEEYWERYRDVIREQDMVNKYIDEMANGDYSDENYEKIVQDALERYD